MSGRATGESERPVGRPLRTLAYLRVSTSGQAEKGMGLDAQRHAVEEFLASPDGTGFELVGAATEAASGAAKVGELFSLEHRPVLLELVERAERGEYDALLVSSLDRLSRDHVEQLYLKRLLAKFGVAVASAAGETNGNGDALSDLVDRLLGAVHDFDRKRIIERTKAGKAAGRRAGHHVAGRVPYGYRASTVPGRLAVDEDQAGVVRSIFKQARGGIGAGGIARRLNADCVAGPTGGAWSRQAVAHLLRNPVYSGELHGVRGAQPAIVSRRVWNQGQ
jgi:site-specific DNA recombinase